MVYDHITGIFENTVTIHPNMNNIILKEFSNNRIQELIRMGSFFGELLHPDMIMSRDIDRLTVIEYKNVAIQILSIREEIESLKLSFKFVDTDFGNHTKEFYMDFPESYNLNARGFTSFHAREFATHDRSEFTLVTFDLARTNHY